MKQAQAHLQQTDALIRAIEANPGDVGTYCELASHYVSAGEFGKAHLTLRRAVEIDPLYADAWVRLGTLHSALGETRLAADAFEQAYALNQADVASLIGRATALLGSQHLAAAGKVRDALLEGFPGRVEPHLIAGHIAKIEGRFADAEAAYERALELEPHQTDVLFNLVELQVPLPEELYARLEHLRHENLSSRDAANVRFALARLHERAGRTDDAFQLYREANIAAEAVLVSSGNGYDSARFEREATAIAASFDAEACAQGLDPLDLGMRMIFIVGVPRSGTTLVERILSSHSRVASGGEISFMPQGLSRLRSAREARGARGALRLHDSEDRRMLQRLRDEYLDALFERELDADYVIDKLPANFSALGLIRMLFPDALLVHCAREPVATCWSLYTAHFGAHLAYYTSFDHLAHYYGRVYRRLMQHWRDLFGADIIEVSYDDLVTNLEYNVRQLLKRCSLPWEDACLRFPENTQPLYTASLVQARQDIYVSSVSRWQQFEKHLQPLVEALKQTS